MTFACVDRQARGKAAALLRRWLQGTVTNYEFDDQWPWDSLDTGVVDIGKETWRYFDDFPERALSPGRLSVDQMSVIERCLRFLESNDPYQTLETGDQTVAGGDPMRRLVSALVSNRSPMELVVEERRKAWWPFSNPNPKREAERS